MTQIRKISGYFHAIRFIHVIRVLKTKSNRHAENH